jgi:NAD(P)-dependent dehydrogenase (short-subunit alcohol dehydrogenase family)
MGVATRFADKVVLVTGASAGIGRTIAIGFAREGATVVVSGRSANGLTGTSEEIEAIGGRADSMAAEISDPAQVAHLVDEIVRRHGRLDVAVNNAGVLGPRGSIDQIADAEFADLINTNVIGTWLCMKHEIAHMRARRSGVIVNLGSVIGTALSRPGMTAYATSKAAVAAMTRSAAREHISDGIRINAVSPGSTDTTMSLLPDETVEGRTERLRTALPIGRVATTEEIANAALWLASDDASFAVGHNLILDGGAAA